MTKRNTRQVWAILLVMVFCFNLLPLQVTTAAAVLPTTPNTTNQTTPAPAPASNLKAGKLIVPNDDLATLAELNKGGATKIEDYGAFSLWQVAPTTARQLNKAPETEFDTIYLQNSLTLNKEGEAKLPANLRQRATENAQLWLVQFVGPIKEDWLQNLAKSGLDPIGYVPNNAYLVWGNGASLRGLSRLPSAQWNGAYHPAYRLNPALDAANLTKKGNPAMVGVTVQFYTHSGVQDSIAKVTALGGKLHKTPNRIMKFTTVSLDVPAAKLEEIAGLPDVVTVIPWMAPKKNDEKQNQVMAGNFTTSDGKIVPSAPGYLNWLNSKGFPTTPASYPIVAVVDDGVDNGTATPLHADFYELGSTSNADRLIFNANCTTDATANAEGGHGNLNLGIVGGYNNQSGYPYKDANGYSFGLGVAPYARLAGNKVFSNDGPYNVTNCGGTDAGVVAKSYNSGADMTSNSWGTPGAGIYDDSSQAYDLLTRKPTVTATREMLHVFSAGNEGTSDSPVGTVGSPGTAKNVLTVAASENVRDNGIVDGCGETAGDNADDMASFSSRGRTSDMRAKPDITAPGTHVQGPASQDPNFNASGVCGGSGDQLYYPNPPQNGTVAQTLYTWSSGTSHSAPAVAGGAALAYNWYGRVLNPGQKPSPAMLKALLLNSPRYMTGLGANDTLPGNGQGWGHINLGMAFDSVARKVIDQSTVFSGTGQVYRQLYQVADNTKPVRVSLVWSDAAADVLNCAKCLMNDLDLEVSVGGWIYRGNNFNGALSVRGGKFDRLNNVENIYLPAGTTGPISIRVTAANLTKNAVPGTNGLSQDFALVIYNAEDTSSKPFVVAINSTLSQLSGDGDNNYEPGETFAITHTVRNDGTQTATGINGTLAVQPAGAVIFTNASSPFSNLAVNGSAINNTPQSFQVNPNLACGTVVTLTYTVNYTGGTAFYETIFEVGGIGAIPSLTQTKVESPPLLIPDLTEAPGVVTSTLNVSGSGQVAKLRITLEEITHTFVSDLSIKLVSPGGKSVTLVSRTGSSGDNFIGTSLDDNGLVSVQNLQASDAPFTGVYSPLQPLAGLRGEAVNGAWKLVIIDDAAQDIGSIIKWKLDFFNYECVQGCASPLSVTQSSDDGTAVTCGSLSYALAIANQQATITNPLTITILTSIQFANQPVGELEIGKYVTLQGSNSCISPPSIAIDGSGQPGGLKLKGGTLKNVIVRGFSTTQITATGGRGTISCVTVLGG
jgi:subtilisin-like proprotein convertase family protein